MTFSKVQLFHPKQEEDISQEGRISQMRSAKLREKNVSPTLTKITFNTWFLPGKYKSLTTCSSSELTLPSPTQIKNLKTSEADDEDTDDIDDIKAMPNPIQHHNLLFCYQSKEQRRLLARYGTMCLLDATYRTTRYALPLFSCV